MSLPVEFEPWVAPVGPDAFPRVEDDPRRAARDEWRASIVVTGPLNDVIEQLVERSGLSRKDIELEVLLTGIAEVQRKMGLEDGSR